MEIVVASWTAKNDTKCIFVAHPAMLAYGYNLDNHEVKSCITAVATKISIYDMDSDQLIIEFGLNQFNRFMAWEFEETQTLYLELNDEITGPTELFYDNCDGIVNSKRHGPVFRSKTYPQIKISKPVLGTYMIWAKAIDISEIEEFYKIDPDFDVEKALNTCCNMEKYATQIKHVCRKLGISDATQEENIGWVRDYGS